MISALSRGVGQSAVAHELYYQARYLFTKDSLKSLHGEIVGVGMIMQLYYNDTPGLIAPYVEMLTRLHAPTCLSEVGIAPTAENVRILRDAIAASAFVGRDQASQEKFTQAFSLIAR
jgi:glycerol dehydrogenase-like iron-containing ADH family enzyme